MIITPAPKPRSSSNSTSSSTRPPTKKRKFPNPDDWIFDTGATTHVCCNRALLHSYDTLNPFTLNQSANPARVGYFGPNPLPIVGAGDCTFILPSLPTANTTASSSTARNSSSVMMNLLRGGSSRRGVDRQEFNVSANTSATSSSPITNGDNGDGLREANGIGDHEPPLLPGSSGPTGPYRAVTRLTLKNIMHIPDAGINLISWSQLKRSKGLDLLLVEDAADGSLIVCEREHGRPLMRFEPRDGLYYLVKADVSPTVRQEIVEGHLKPV